MKSEDLNIQMDPNRPIAAKTKAIIVISRAVELAESPIEKSPR